MAVGRFDAAATTFLDDVSEETSSSMSIDMTETTEAVARLIGHLRPDDRLALQPPRYKELSIHLVSGWTRERLDATLAAVADGTLDTRSLVTHRFPVARAAEAWALITSKREPVLGVILDW